MRAQRSAILARRLANGPRFMRPSPFPSDRGQVLQRAVSLLAIRRADERPLVIVLAEQRHLRVVRSLADNRLIRARSLANVQVGRLGRNLESSGRCGGSDVEV